MPMSEIDYKLYSRTRRQLIAKIKAKGLVEGTNKFSSVLSRKLLKKIPPRKRLLTPSETTLDDQAAVRSLPTEKAGDP